MLKPRIIPTLLIKNNGLVKTSQFDNPIYVGDPINAVKIFNEKEVDELIILDIEASVNKSQPNYELIRKIASECRMPLCYGGGINKIDQIDKIISLGVEKVSMCSSIQTNPDLYKKASKMVGAQSIVGAIDIIKEKNDYICYIESGSKKIEHNPFELIKFYNDSKVGEILLNFISNDGMMCGFDIDFIKLLSKKIVTPYTILGGASSINDFRESFLNLGTIGISAGSLFVFKGKYKAVLINYFNSDEKKAIFEI